MLDEDGDFEKRCNMAMVELEPVRKKRRPCRIWKAASWNRMAASTSISSRRATRRQLRSLIENHQRYTGSARAQQMLDNWSAYLPKFVKIMPTDYRRALEKLATTAQVAAANEVESVLHG